MCRKYPSPVICHRMGALRQEFLEVQLWRSKDLCSGDVDGYSPGPTSPLHGNYTCIAPWQNTGTCLCVHLQQCSWVMSGNWVSLQWNGSLKQSWMELGLERTLGSYLPVLWQYLWDVSSVLCVSPQSKLVKYFSRQLSCKKKVALQERNAELDGFPQLRHWFRIVDVRKEVLEVTGGDPCPMSLTSWQPAPSGSGVLAVSGT